MVLSTELRQSKFVELRVAEILLRENLPTIVHALSLIDNLSRIASLGMLPFALLRDDVLFDTAIDLNVVIPATDLIAVLETISDGAPVLVCSDHRWVGHTG